MLVAGALFMEILDATIIAPAVPLIAESFRVDPVDVNIAISAYLVTVAVLIPASGWVADRFGTRRVFVAAIAVFTLASIGCAASVSLPMLVAMRVLQGVGGAMMVPVGRLAVLRSSTKSDLVRAIALLTWPALAAPVIAPLLGGAIATLGSWRWIFVINIPLGLLGILLSLKLVHGTASRSARRLDWRGLLGVGTGIAAALIALESIRVTGTDWRRVVIGGVVAVVLLVASAVHLVRTPHPLVDVRVLRVRTLRTTVAGGSLYRLIVTAVPFLLPLQFQLGFGWTPFLAGLLVAALFAGNIAIKPCTTPLMRRFGIRPVLLVNALLSVVCFGLLASLSASTPLPVIAAVLFVSGALRSVGFTAYNSLAFSDVERADLTHANTLNAAVQELAAGLGIALAALALTAFTPLATSSEHGFGSEYSWTFVLLGLLMLGTVVDTLRLPRDAGASVTR
ncbi:putative MFS transporter [Rhodococcus opacus B4]|uniref:Putative MFS transporter n=2 Tax=Rhodococcus opacus TaxID=37919 RepID=C1AVN1_RHOOB|nr:putative MFS transporter [Rhodococcus opacus B4]